MSSSRPRVQGGYFDAPRYLLDAIIAAPRLTGAQVRVVLGIMRLTWGYYPEKNRDGARIKHRVLAERTGLEKRTVDKVIPALVGEGIVEQVAAATGRLPAVLRVNTDPSKWGRFAPVGYAEDRTLDAEGHQTAEGASGRSTQGATTVAPTVRQPSLPTDSHSPSSSDPSYKSDYDYAVSPRGEHQGPDGTCRLNTLEKLDFDGRLRRKVGDEIAAALAAAVCRQCARASGAATCADREDLCAEALYEVGRKASDYITAHRVRNPSAYVRAMIAHADDGPAELLGNTASDAAYRLERLRGLDRMPAAGAAFAMPKMKRIDDVLKSEA